LTNFRALKDDREFNKLARFGMRVSGSICKARVIESKAPLKIGIVTPKTAFKMAVLRNRARRRVRESCKRIGQEYNHLNVAIVIYPGAAALTADLEDIVTDIKCIMEKISDVNKKASGGKTIKTL
jgi:ribonuclease P protein component